MGLREMEGGECCGCGILVVGAGWLFVSAWTVLCRADLPAEPDHRASAGYYQMDELDGIWIFFTQNFLEDAPLTMSVVGNLGHDGSGHVSAYEFSARPWKGFVKATCEGSAIDPSVNHMWIVDGGYSSGFRPRHSCEGGGGCEGSR